MGPIFHHKKFLAFLFPFNENITHQAFITRKRKEAMRLRQIRKERGLTQTQLGEVIGNSAPTIYRLETGREPIRLSDLRTLAAFFGVSVAVLIEDETLETAPVSAPTNGQEPPHA